MTKFLEAIFNMMRYRVYRKFMLNLHSSWIH